MALGDAHWELEHGNLTPIDRWRYALEAVRARLRILARRFVREPPAHLRALDRVAFDRVTYPDSACAKAALSKLEALASPAIVNHSLRTYIWGCLLGQIDGKRSDEEIFYVAATLHDLGLTDGLHGSSPKAQCFTLDAVNGAADVLAQTSDERAERIRRAVLLHLNIEVPGEVHGWEAHYVRAGALLDVIGERHEQLPRDTIDAVLALHPRCGLKRELLTWIAREARLRPGSRFALLSRLGLAPLVRGAPFDS